MIAYKGYFYKVLHSISLLSNDSPPLRPVHKAQSERGLKRQPKAASELSEMRPFDDDLPSVLPAEKNGVAAEETSPQFEAAVVGKPLYSPFWFWNNNIADELALEFIREGDGEKAMAIWEKTVFSKDKRKLAQVEFIDNLITQSSDWLEEKDEYHCLIRNDDGYIISREKKTGSSVPCVFADLNYEHNWTIEVDTQWLEGVDKYSYGLVFGREQNNYYSFVVTGNGHYSLVKQTKGDYKEIIPWKTAFAINKCSTNHLLLKKIDDQLSLFINNNYLGSVQSEPFFGKGFGFKVWGNQKVSFKNFKFCNFAEEEAKFKVTKDNYSCIKNLSMLYLGLATKNNGLDIDHFKKGVELAKVFYTTKQKEGYAKLVEGERYFYHPEKTIHFYLSEVVDSVKKYIDKPDGISTSDFIGSFSDFPAETRQLFSNIFFSNRIQKIEREIEISRATKKSSAASAADAGKKLVKNTREDMLYLRNFLGEHGPGYAPIADKLARAIMQCGIDYYSKLFDVDYKLANSSIESYLPEHKYALHIAVSVKTKDMLKEILNLYQKKIREAKEKISPGKEKRRMAYN
jgi:hypothetical protein